MKQIYDPLRKEWFNSSPEERVRQKWLEVMVGHLSFPKELIVVEKSLKALEHVPKNIALPDRRVDILAYTKKEGVLVPLLLIECKCIPLTEKALFQVQGYNEFIGAKYIAIANETEIQVGFEDKEGAFSKIDFLPACPLLIKALG